MRYLCDLWETEKPKNHAENNIFLKKIERLVHWFESSCIQGLRNISKLLFAVGLTCVLTMTFLGTYISRLSSAILYLQIAVLTIDTFNCNHQWWSVFVNVLFHDVSGIDTRSSGDYPRVSYMTALDLFVSMSFVYIFFSIVLFAFVHINTKYCTADNYYRMPNALSYDTPERRNKLHRRVRLNQAIKRDTHFSNYWLAKRMIEAKKNNRKLIFDLQISN